MPSPVPSAEFVPPTDGVAAAIRRALTAWFDAHARDLPWRRTRDPYAIWVSEAMLQQTRVEVVKDYWPRFLRSFPTVAALAGASEDAVLEAWAGLGYYRRARSLQAAARVIVTEHGGAFPLELEAALALPGVGPYTAGAVLSIAADLPVALVDGNVERVFARLFAIDGARGSGPLQRSAWSAARHFVERTADGVAPRVWNQALMELGATVCTASSPRCVACPVAEYCRARVDGLQAELPRPKPRRAPLEVELKVFAVARRQRAAEEWLVARRPEGGLMAGMWEFPTIEVTGPELFPRTLDPLRFEESKPLFTIAHGITKHRIRAEVVEAAVASLDSTTVDSPSLRWASAESIAGLALTGMARKVLDRLDSGARPLFAAT